MEPKLKLDQAQIDEWKKSHGEIHRIEVSETPEKFDPYKVPDDDDTAEIPNAVVGYLRRPNDRELNFAQSKMPNFTDAGKVILKACWLGGDERILNDPKLFRSAALQCLELLEVQRTRLKKL